jgi:hypothetical protein
MDRAGFLLMETSTASVFPGRHSDIFGQEPLEELFRQILFRDPVYADNYSSDKNPVQFATSSNLKYYSADFEG